jgi:hypothetical protein
MSAYGMNYFFGENVKACKKCGELKSPDAFPKVPKARDGRGGRCYACAYAAKAVLVDDDKRAKNAARARKWKSLNQGKVKARRSIDKELDRQRRAPAIAERLARLQACKAERDAAKAAAKAERMALTLAQREERRLALLPERAIATAVYNMDAAVRRDIKRYIVSPLVVPGGAYVYLITVDHVIRYVGKGNGKRALCHIKTAIVEADKIRRRAYRRTTNLYSNLYNAIVGQRCINVNIVRDGMSDHDAYRLESRLIDAIRPMGILWNVANGRVAQ